MKSLIDGCNKIFLSLPGKKKPVRQEYSTMKFAFASVVSIKDIKKGEKFSLKNLWVKRPGTGYFLAKDLKKILGKTSLNNIKRNIQIRKRDVKF